jgi:hypothetical protein
MVSSYCDVGDGDGDYDDKEEPTDTFYSGFFFISYGAAARFRSMAPSPFSPPFTGDSKQLSFCKMMMSASRLIPSLEDQGIFLSDTLLQSFSSWVALPAGRLLSACSYSRSTNQISRNV